MAPPPLTPIKGTLDILVLKALTWGPMHGFEISTWIEENSSGALGIEDSAMYQALYRLEARDMLEAEWGLTEQSRRARYYRLTSAGRAHLKRETAQWTRYALTVTALLSLSSKRS